MNNNIPIQQVIDQGLKIMQNGQVTDAMYQVWVEYSKSILNMTTKIHQYILIIYPLYWQPLIPIYNPISD